MEELEDLNLHCHAFGDLSEAFDKNGNRALAGFLA